MESHNVGVFTFYRSRILLANKRVSVTSKTLSVPLSVHFIGVIGALLNRLSTSRLSESCFRAIILH
jgi:hypothetical protein